MGINAIAYLAAVCLLGATELALAGELPKHPVPIELKLAWIGKACNKDGNVQVTMTNKSQTPITTFRAGSLGNGGMFIARLKINGDEEIYATSGHGFSVPYYLGPTPSEKDLIVIEPGKSASYTLRLSFKSSAREADSFSEAYDKLIKKGGKFGVYYALRKFTVRSDLADNMYFVGDDWFPAIDTNDLRC